MGIYFLSYNEKTILQKRKMPIILLYLEIAYRVYKQCHNKCIHMHRHALAHVIAGILFDFGKEPMIISDLIKCDAVSLYGRIISDLIK